jgi:hypothetical protein
LINELAIIQHTTSRPLPGRAIYWKDTDTLLWNLPGEISPQPLAVDSSIFNSRIQARPLSLKLTGLAQHRKGRYWPFTEERIQHIEQGIPTCNKGVCMNGLTELN